MPHEQKIFELADDLQQDVLMAIMIAICPFNQQYGWGQLLELGAALSDALNEIDVPPELADDEAGTQEDLIMRIKTHLRIYLRMLPLVADEERALRLLTQLTEKVSVIRAQTTHVMSWEAEEEVERLSN